MKNLKKVLVIGGGIGGLSTAIALRKHGIEVDVLEKNKAWSVYHVGIIVQGNFIRALCDLGVGDEALLDPENVQGFHAIRATAKAFGLCKKQSPKRCAIAGRHGQFISTLTGERDAEKAAGYA
jgi:2-polyprenyl-6-methoxyphenol hydroxylase-like FAD-dependent oxidoreductase